ncbi:NUDIX domain-containing protein [Candidatus Microgenomates bacterium]|nr:NUDIX domain-containing protein [Candidatus Microgenomates bacterium]
MKREFSAGGVVYKKVGSEVLWLIIKEKPSVDFPGDRYQFPKGWVNSGESVEEAALREVKEESAIEAKIISKLDTVKFIYTFRGEKIFKIITYFLMAYISGQERPDNVEIDQVLWLPFEEASKILTISSGKTLLRKAQALLVK